MISEAGAFFVGRRVSTSFYQEKGKRFGTPYVVTVDHYSPEARKTTGLGEGTRL